jgi:DnaJ-class molecular chaperone
MRPTSHYLILEITPQASESEIERAYRTLCSRHDAGEAGEYQLREIDEAYKTLSDRAGRAESHRQMAQSPAPPLWPEPMNLFGSFATYRPSREAIFNAFVHGSTGRGIPKSRQLGRINLELVVSPAEAARGGSLPIDIPIARLCPCCDGTGRTGFFHCDACDGEGVTHDHARIELRVPPTATDRATIPLSLHPFGVDAIGLNVHVRVTGA